MLKNTRMIASLVTAGALLAVPAAGHATKPDDKGKSKSSKSAKSCTKAHSVGFTVKGTFVRATADDPATPVNEATVTLKVTSANSHARKSGDITAGGEFTVAAANDAYDLELKGYEGTDTMSADDTVKVHGKIVRIKKKCAAPAMSVADRYGAINVRKVTISDNDA